MSNRKTEYLNQDIWLIAIGATLSSGALYAAAVATNLLVRSIAVGVVFVGLGILFYGFRNLRRHSRPAWKWEWKEQ